MVVTFLVINTIYFTFEFIHSGMVKKVSGALEIPSGLVPEINNIKIRSMW